MSMIKTAIISPATSVWWKLGAVSGASAVLLGEVSALLPSAVTGGLIFVAGQVRSARMDCATA